MAFISWRVLLFLLCFGFLCLQLLFKSFFPSEPVSSSILLTGHQPQETNGGPRQKTRLERFNEQQAAKDNARKTEESLTVSCGGHWASSCAGCSRGNGAAWCHGSCTWAGSECVELPPVHERATAADDEAVETVPRQAEEEVPDRYPRLSDEEAIAARRVVTTPSPPRESDEEPGVFFTIRAEMSQKVKDKAQSCDEACQADGGTCSEDVTSRLSDKKTLEKSVRSAGYKCKSFLNLNIGHQDWDGPWIDLKTRYGGVCGYSENPLWKASCSAHPAGGFWRLCGCRGTRSRGVVSGPGGAPQYSQTDLGLYCVITDSKFYKTRLKYMMDTWAGEVDRSSLIIVGDEPYHGEYKDLYVVETTCTTHNHDAACCKIAFAYWAMWQQMKKMPEKEWATLVDDDTFVVHAEVNRVIHSNRKEKHGFALGIVGCAHQTCGGFCGGGGNSVNREQFRLLFEGKNPPKSIGDFVAEIMKLCKLCGMWNDQAISMAMRNRGLQLTGDAGRMGWRMQRGQFDGQLRAHSDDPPLLFHYIKSGDQMRFLHGIFGQVGKRSGGEIDAVDPRVADGVYRGPCAVYGAQPFCAVRLGNLADCNSSKSEGVVKSSSERPAYGVFDGPCMIRGNELRCHLSSCTLYRNKGKSPELPFDVR